MSLASVRHVNRLLRERHYLGPCSRGWAWETPEGAMVFANPTSRRLPQRSWLELVRWCLVGGPNAGSRQWAGFVSWARDKLSHTTTFVSYSDPAQGHTGALYRASGWLWAPTWHRLRPPPTGNGAWTVRAEGVKDRWVFCLRRDDQRESLIALNDEALARQYPWASYAEPKWKRGRPHGGGADYPRWFAERGVAA